jgi:alpha-L-fucosidase
LNSSPTGESRGLTANLVEWLADCAAKGGGLEPAIFLGPPSHFELAKRCLLGLGAWLKVNGDAIYDTRPWQDGKPQDMTAAGTPVRYTTRGDALYAILFRWEPGGPTFPRLRAAESATVQLLGVPPPSLQWDQTEGGLAVRPVAQDMVAGKVPNVPCDHAFVYRITPRPEWVE